MADEYKWREVKQGPISGHYIDHVTRRCKWCNATGRYDGKAIWWSGPLQCPSDKTIVRGDGT